jgi:hypothetical protein
MSFIMYWPQEMFCGSRKPLEKSDFQSKELRLLLSLFDITKRNDRVPRVSLLRPGNVHS